MPDEFEAATVLLLDGPLAGGRTLILDLDSTLTEGSEFVVGLRSGKRKGITERYVVTRGFEVTCRDGHVHRKMIAKHVPGVAA